MSLVVIYAGLLATTLYAESSFHLAIPLSLINPYEFYKTAASGFGLKGVAIDMLEGAVGCVIGKFGAFGGRPSIGVVIHCLGAVLWVGTFGRAGGGAGRAAWAAGRVVG